MAKQSKSPVAASVSEVPSIDYLDIVHQHLTKSFCDEVFDSTRTHERQRKWTLFALVWFWLGLLQSRWSSQTRAVLEGQKGHPLFPKVDASPESFFQKIQNVRPSFFRNIFVGFGERTASEYKANFASSLDVDLTHFPDIFGLDGSRLESVARRLKITRSTTKAILPGSMEALYDLRRGRIHDLWFDPNGHASELSMMAKLIDSVPTGALILADRLYAKPVVWRKLDEIDVFMVSRWNKTVNKRKLRVLSETRGKVSIDDWIVAMGGSDGSTPVELRWVHVWGDGFDVVLITNVMDPEILSGLKLAALYRKRWTVERMYLAMKDLLELNHLYNCSPAAVGQQVYATAILYNALRLAQSKLAEKSGVLPDDLSEQKLFPTLIENFIKALQMDGGAQWMFEKIMAIPGQVQIPKPEMPIDHPQLSIRIKDYLIERRSSKRRQRRWCDGRKGHTAFGKIPGTKHFLEI